MKATTRRKSIDLCSRCDAGQVESLTDTEHIVIYDRCFGCAGA